MAYPSFSVGEVLTANDMNSVGMWKVGSGTFTTASEVLIDSVFSLSYERYLLQIEWVASQNTSTRLQFRANGNNNTDSNYIHQVTYFTTSTTYDRNVTQTTSSLFSADIGGVNVSHLVWFTNPKQTAVTIVKSQGEVNGTVPTLGSARYNATTSFDGVRIYQSAGVFTGVYSIYGYK